MDHVGKLDTPDPDDKRKEEELEEGEVVLPGFRFHPTDEELVGFYLKRKVEKKPLRIELIKHVDIYKYDPWDLPKVSSLLGEKEWYFFCRRGRKYKNSVRPNRVTRSGFWKATGIDKSIYSCCTVKEHHQCIGLKKSLVYYRGSAGKGTKTEWMMHEFRLPPPNANKITNNNNNPHDHNATNVDLHEAEVWTLCRIFKRIPSYKKYTPNLKDSAAVLTKLPNVQQVDCKDPLVMPHLIERKPVLIEHVDEKKHFFLGPFGSVAHQAPLSTVSHPSSNLNPDIEEALIGNHENWDDLRSMVQFAINDPSAVYDCSTETYIPPYYF